MIPKKYVKWIILFAAIAILVLVVANPFEIIYTIDQSNEAAATGYVVMDATTQDTYPVVAQAFQMSTPVAGNVNWICFSAMRSSIVTGNIHVQIWKDNGINPVGPDTILKTFDYPALTITGATTWINIPINCTYANMQAGFIVLDFSDCSFTTGSYIRVYYSGNSYHVDDDIYGIWSGMWKRTPAGAWSVDMTKDLRFRAYRGLIRCWRCSGSIAEYQDFGWGTTCGSGAASNYPYTTEPTCGGSQNNPPVCTDISGPTEGIIGEDYTYVVSGFDPDGDPVQYKVEWGDGIVSPYQSSATFHHTFWQADYFSVKGRLKDSNGAESSWGPILMVLFTEDTSNPLPDDFSLYLLIILIIIGIVGTIVAIKYAPGMTIKIGASVIIWIVIAIIYLLVTYGGIL